MDSKTIAYYSENAQSIAERYESIVNSLANNFGLAFKPKSKLLDIGCGSGRDLALLAASGHDCFGLDATQEFVELSQSLHPELRGRVVQSSLPDFRPPFGGGFDGVLCSAVLMHIPEDQLVPSALAIKRCLKKHGRLLYSVPSERADVAVDHRDSMGRLFIPDQADRMQTIFEQLGFDLISKWENEDSLGRDSVKWASVLMELNNP